MSVKPITPSEADENKEKAFPPEVIEAFNEMILEHFDGHSATFESNQVAKLIANKCKVKVDYIYENHWLDVEKVFRKYGWIVEYDQPGYNESYAATFEFRKKRG